MKLLTFTASLLACYLLGSTARAADKLPEELLVVRAQPAVFKILAIGDVNLSYPQHVTTIKNPSTSASQARAILEGPQSLLAAEYARDQRDGVIAKDKARSEYYWEKVTENPQRYLVASKELLHRTLSDVQYASGTGFAISREGILLTNAHVVQDMDQLVDPLLGQPFEDLVDNLAREFGSKPPDAIKGDTLAEWFILQSRGSAKFKQAQMVLKFDTLESFEQWRKKHPGKSQLVAMGDFAESKTALTIPVKVLVAGDAIPGKDVAVLKVDDKEVLDRLICLPLGNSDSVLPNTPVQAMGFPGTAFNPDLLAPEAQFLVSNQPGTIGQTKPMKFGWDAFEMSAQIHHGDSGGPVLDRHGDVIGLNVGTATPQVARITLAVPINVAKEFLAKAQINPDPGPLTQLWIEGLVAFAGHHYSEATDKLFNVLQRQKISPVSLSTFDASSPVDNRFENRYVSNMWWRSKQMSSK